MHNGFFAERVIKTQQQQEQDNTSLSGTFLGEKDYFEQERQRLIDDFYLLSVEDDLRLHQKEFLV